MKFRSLVVLIFFCSISLSLAPMAYAQKQKKTKEPAVKKSDNSISDSPQEAEYYFTEAMKYYILEDFSRALSLFQKSLEIQPNNAAIHYKIAEILGNANELDKALYHAQRAKKEDPNNKYYYVLLANVYTKKGNFNAATAVFEEMISRLPDTEEYNFELAAIYMFQKEYTKALMAYQRAEKKYGVIEQISLQKQELFLQSGKLNDAIAEANKLIELNPEEARYTLNLAQILLSNNREKEALILLEGFLVDNPNNGEINLLISEVYRQNNQSDKAIASLMKAMRSPEVELTTKIKVLGTYLAMINIPDMADRTLEMSKILTEVHPDDVNAQALYADILFTLGRKEEAKDQYLQVLKIDENNFNVWQNIITVQMEQSRWDSVIYYSGEAMVLFPNQASLYYFNGASHLAKKDYRLAISAFEQGKKLSASNLPLLGLFNSQLGDAYNGTKNYVKSDEAYEAALQFDPDNYYVLNNYSYYLSLRKEKLDQAKKMSAKVVKANPDNATYIDTYAWVLYQMGEYQEAKKQFEKAIQLDAEGIIFEHYGDVLFKLGQIDQAVLQWQKAKGMNDTSELIDKKIADRKLYE